MAIPHRSGPCDAALASASAGSTCLARNARRARTHVPNREGEDARWRALSSRSAGHSGRLAATQAWLARCNAPLARSAVEWRDLLAERLAEVGENAVVRPPFHCDYGFNIRLGRDVFLNFNCVILDVTEVTIGEGTQIGPAVQIYGADHPREPSLRRRGLEFGRPVRIGRHVWIGGGAIVLPGVVVADEAVIGAGSVVTRDVEEGAVVAGNPARRISR